VMVKILTNALQALPGGGTIQLKTSMNKKEQRISVDCHDDGVGIAKDHLGRVFEPFYTTKQRGLEKSSGLGLAIVYSVIKSFQGDVIITSNLRTGTHVRILLPVYSKRIKKK